MFDPTNIYCFVSIVDMVYEQFRALNIDAARAPHQSTWGKQIADRLGAEVQGPMTQI